MGDELMVQGALTFSPVTEWIGAKIRSAADRIENYHCIKSVQRTNGDSTRPFSLLPYFQHEQP
jgi:hypothetical protein